MFFKIIKSFCVISYEFFMGCLFNLPRYKTINYFKKLLLILMGAKIGKDVIFYPGVWICPGRNLIVGNEVNFAKDVLINSSGGVKVGDRVLIGYRTQILSANHDIPPVGKRIPVSGKKYSQIIIENDVWIGANCLILPGVRIGEGAIIAGGSVVTNNVAENSIVAGVPAKFLKMRSLNNE